MKDVPTSFQCSMNLPSILTLLRSPLHKKPSGQEGDLVSQGLKLKMTVEIFIFMAGFEMMVKIPNKNTS